MNKLIRYIGVFGSLAGIASLALIMLDDQLKVTFVRYVAAGMLFTSLALLGRDIVLFFNKVDESADIIKGDLANATAYLATVASVSVGTGLAPNRWESIIRDADWELKDLDYVLEYKDRSGYRVYFSKTQHVLAKKPLTEMWDTNIRCDGEIDPESFYTSMGKIQRSPDDIERYKLGSMISLRTAFDTAIPQGREFQRRFGYAMINSFLKTEETFVLHIPRPVPKFSVELKVPEPLKLLAVSGEIRFGHFKRSDFAPRPNISNDQMSASWLVTNPQMGERYIIRYTVDGLIPNEVESASASKPVA